MEEKENPLERDHTLVVVLPGELERTMTVHGSKPVMDLLVTLCAQNHLNPSEHLVELFSANSNQITFKPNSPIGGLEAERIILKPKDNEEKIKKPYVPEATVRLLINYKQSHKAVVRVNPRMPLEQHMPAVCEKCEFDVASTILLRDSNSQEPLDLTKSLNDHGVREVFAKDSAAVSPSDVSSPPQEACIEDTNPPKTEEKKPKKDKENKGFFSLFKRSKNKTEKGAAVSNQRALNGNSLANHSSNTLPIDMPKKRRAPLPPLVASCSVPSNLNTHQPASPEGQTSGLIRLSSSESCLKRTKRRAPPPPSVTTHNPGVEESDAHLYTVEELVECEEISSASSPSPPSPLLHPRGDDDTPPPNPEPSVGGVEPAAPLSLQEILTSSLVKRHPVTRSSSAATVPRTSSARNGFSSPPLRRDVVFISGRGSPIKLRSTSNGGPRRGGMTTFTVVPRGSLLRRTALELELTPGLPEQLPHKEDPSSTILTAAGSMDEPSRAQEVPGSPEPESPRPEPGSGVRETTDSPSSSSVPASSENQPGRTSPSLDEETEEDLRGTSDLPGDSGSPTVLHLTSVLVHSNGTPGDDVTSSPEQEASCGRSSAEVRLNAGSVQDHVEEDEEAQEDEEYSFPPPPPPIFFSREMDEGEKAPHLETETSIPPSQFLSPSFHDPPSGLAPVSSPRPKMPDMAAKLLRRTGTVPSRFAQAVALAVQRSQPGPRGGGPCPGPEASAGAAPSSTLAHTSMVPEWLPCSSLNGNSCLG